LLNRLAIFLLLATIVSARTAEPIRPHLLGIAHMALFVSDLGKARAFYKNFLGFDEPYVLRREDGSDRIAFIKINDDQYLELFAEDPKQDGHLNHISFFTDSADAMRLYLAANNVKVPERVSKGKIGNLNFTITDPDGHTVEIVQYEPDGWTRRERGRYLPETRISAHMTHVGVTVGALDPALKFYRDILGLQEIWRGSSSGKTLSWVNMRVPDGNDYLEFMLYATPPDREQLGGKNHVCLLTPDIEKAVATLQSRRQNYSRPIEIKVGVNGKRQANLFDPDGTRIELMEPNTADGKPVPPSAAPAPR
jgi:catechol 2,3-dioxygenase-like lactoylglutathione lyase family enzyme